MPKKTRLAAKQKRVVASAARVQLNADEPQEDTFPIVGIGASAGGYEAFVQLLKALPTDTGMAFIFIMHLEPEHKSMLAKLLSNVTRMPVAEASNGLAVKPNHVYVITPKTDLGIQNGVLRIVPRSATGGRYLPVDNFLTSLAQDRPSSSIGVILSGTASDGTLGLKAIKAAGGITFAQNEGTSKYHGMPGSAIASGSVDFVLPPEAIGKELERLARHPYLGVPQTAKLPELPAVGETDFGKVLHLLHSATGVEFTGYKPGTIRRRVARRMVLQKMEDMGTYARFLRSNRGEIDALFQDILIHVTSFFREPEAFKILQARVFPKIVAGKKRGEAVRVWVPGCSTGEEVYSLTIALFEFLGERASSTSIQVFGTDISEVSIDKARAGIYSKNSLRDVSSARMRRFFTATEGGYRVNKALRESCIFARQDLTKDPPFSRIDLISCRNVLIYLGASLQKRIIASFHYALHDSGFLLLGKSETLTAYLDLFALADRKAPLYIKKLSRGKPAPEFVPAPFEKTALPVPMPEEPAFDALREADRLVWQRYAHAGLVLNDDLDILHFRGETSPYLAPVSGKASLHVLRMVKEELRMELRAAIQKARRTNAPVRSTGLHVKHNGHKREIHLEVEPLNRGGGKERYFLVLFEDAGTAVPLAQEEKRAIQTQRYSGEREVEQLRRELEASREYVQSVVEQQEAGNEELKSANEEILSSNEELQSTNEELETAKEELQSTNEELVTLNETLQNRNTELAQLTDDLANVLDGSNIPILIVGNDGRIRRLTPSAESLLNLLPGDVGRPIGNIRPNVDIPDLDAVIAEVSRTFAEVQRDVRDKEGRWYSLRIRPYRTADNKIAGVLMALLDINGLKCANEALSESEATVRALLENLGHGILVVDKTGKIVIVNAGAEAIFGYRRADLLGQSIDLLLPERLRDVHAQHRTGYLRAPKVRPMGNNVEPVGRRKNGKEFPVEVTLSYIETANTLLAVATVVDLSEQRRTAAALDEKESALQFSQGQVESLTATLLSAQEEERERLARELHDDLNQRLAALAVKAGVLQKQLPTGSGDARDQMRGFRQMIDEMTEDVRRMAHQLHPSILDHFGLAKALDSLCEEFRKLKGFSIGFRQRNLPADIPREIGLSLYRVSQELLSNVAQHSGAKTVSVTLAGAAGGLHLVVSDDGAGFDAAAVSQKPGLGLTSMRERLRVAGGTLSIKSKPGEGTRIEARIPLPAKSV
ncbi:MAG TPA: chemotaxis protein CheB [Acidobacteriaceae bacterium]|nr:chemotaxis protein CheB [Acidobacteriaceae bacterium]